jgi:hypothetical protein
VAVAPRGGNFNLRGGGGFYSRGYNGGGRYYGGAGYYGGSRYYGGARYYGGGSRYYGGRYYAAARFYRPYYAFRPRFSLGFGLFLGYPINYSYPYYYPSYDYPYNTYPYAYPYPYASTYPAPAPTYQAPVQYDPAYPPQAQSSVGVQPGVAQSNTGGLSFEITPSDARVIVDGHDVGTVGQFTSTSEALGLPAGRHHVEIVANGYRTMSSDVDVIPGQVIPFQGVMQR